MTFGSKNEFQITLLFTNIKFDQKIWSCLLIFDQSFREDNSNLCVFSNNLTIIAISRGKPLKEMVLQDLSDAIGLFAHSLH